MVLNVQSDFFVIFVFLVKPFSGNSPQVKGDGSKHQFENRSQWTLDHQRAPTDWIEPVQRSHGSSSSSKHKIGKLVWVDSVKKGQEWCHRKKNSLPHFSFLWICLQDVFSKYFLLQEFHFFVSSSGSLF